MTKLERHPKLEINNHHKWPQEGDGLIQGKKTSIKHNASRLVSIKSNNYWKNDIYYEIKRIMNSKRSRISSDTGKS